MRLHTVYYISVNCSLYMFRVVTPPIIRSTYKCNYSIWHWSNCLCYLTLSWRSWNSSTKAEGSRDGLTSTCFGWQLHPSSGAHITIITESGTGQTVSATFHYGGEVPTSPLIAEGSRDGLTSARFCNYIYMCS